MFCGVDAAVRHDTASVVGVRRDGDRLIIAFHRIWRPSPDHPLDLEATIEAYLREMHDQYHVKGIYCDPYQLHRSIMTLQAAGLRIEEYPQTTCNTTHMGQSLFELLKGKNLTLYADPELREQALNTIAVESRNGGFRIAKERASKKIDSTVALSMACVAALKRMNRGPLIITGGYDIEPLSVQAQQAKLDRETAEQVARSAASIAETVKKVGAWGFPDW